MISTSPEDADQPLRVLMTADAVGGVWRYSLDLTEALVAHGAEVLLATMGPRPSEEQRRQVAAIANVSLAESDYLLEWMPHPWTDIETAGTWLLDLAQDFGADMIHLNGYAHAALPWRRPVMVVAHSCVFSWWRAVHRCAPGAEWDEYHHRVLTGLTAADVVVAPSEAMARSVSREYGLALEAVRVIHNFSNTETSQRLQKQPFFLAAGRVWDQAKNIALLEQVAPRVKWELRVSGDGYRAENTTAAVPSIRFLGMLPYAELLQEMAVASVFVHPAFYEPFGLSVLEAARRRCCLVLADIPSLRELWCDAAVFVDPRDPDRLVEELNRLSSHPELRQDFADRAHSHALQYNSGIAVRQYQDVYRSLLTRGKPSSSEAAA